MNLLNIEDNLYIIKRSINPQYFNDSKDSKKLIGMWVDHLGCDKVVLYKDRYLFLNKIEEAQEITETQET
jgi:hypothetical protein